MTIFCILFGLMVDALDKQFCIVSNFICLCNGSNNIIFTIIYYVYKNANINKGKWGEKWCREKKKKKIVKKNERNKREETKSGMI